MSDSHVKRPLDCPNIFDWATSELSQDAFLSWLAACADSNRTVNERLRETGKAFIKKCFALHAIELRDEILSVKIQKQYKKTDILIRINDDKYVIVVEDKVNTSDHNNQLQRYKNSIQSDFGNSQLVFIYYKTFYETSWNADEKAGFKRFTIEEMLEILKSGLESKSEILIGYYNRLTQINSLQKDFTKLLNRKDDESWKGFFNLLQNEFGKGEWGFVPNNAGGFYGFWWCFQENKDCISYLQLEAEKLCFKIEVINESMQKSIRDKWSKVILNLSKSKTLGVSKPERFGLGVTMTVAVIKNYIGDVNVNNYKLDLDKIIALLCGAEDILNEACSILTKENI